MHTHNTPALMHACTHTHTHTYTHACMHTHAHAHLHTNTYTPTHTTHTCAHMHMHTHIHVHATHIHTHAHACMHACTYMCTHRHLHTHTHTHTHTNTSPYTHIYLTSWVQSPIHCSDCDASVFYWVERQLDWDRLWHELGHCAGHCPAPRDGGTWAAALPDFYCAPQPRHQGHAVGETPRLWWVHKSFVTQDTLSWNALTGESMTASLQKTPCHKTSCLWWVC